jgi:alpha-N-arabinofuranosidase
MTETGGSAWRQTIYWPYYYASHYGRGEVLDIRLNVPSYENTRQGRVPFADCVAVYHRETQELDIFVINRNQEEPLEMSLDLSGFGNTCTVLEHITLSHSDLDAVNDRDNPDEVYPEVVAVHKKVECSSYCAILGSLTWNLLRLSFA